MQFFSRKNLYCVILLQRFRGNQICKKLINIDSLSTAMYWVFLNLKTYTTYWFIERNVVSWNVTYANVATGKQTAYLLLSYARNWTPQWFCRFGVDLHVYWHGFILVFHFSSKTENPCIYLRTFAYKNSFKTNVLQLFEG